MTQTQDINRLRNLALGRDAVNEVRRLALFLDDDSADQALLTRVADFLDDARTVLRGGPRELTTRKWNMT